MDPGAGETRNKYSRSLISTCHRLKEGNLFPRSIDKHLVGKLTSSPRRSILGPIYLSLTRTWIKHIVELRIFEVQLIRSDADDRAYGLLDLSRRLYRIYSHDGEGGKS